MFDLKYVPLGRVRCRPKSETFNSFTGLPPYQLCGLSAACLRVTACLGAWLALPSLRGDPGGFAHEIADLICPSSPRICLLESITGFTVWQNLQKCLYLGQIAEFERKKVLHVRLKPKNTRLACRDTPDMNEASQVKLILSP